METCPQCGAITPPSDIDGHPYFGASRGCWAIYGKVLEREYSDPKFFTNHRQTVDAYALQHPAYDDPRAIQSVNVHLIALTLLYGANMSSNKIPKVMDSIVKKTKNTDLTFNWLEPPESRGSVIVTDILPLNELQAHLTGVDSWAKAAWDAWGMHHDVAWQYIRLEGIT